MDTIGEFFTRIRNAGRASHEKVDIPASNLRKGLAEILMQSGFVRSFRVADDSKQGIMRVYLRYDNSGRHAISNVQRVSRPGRRVYIKATEIPEVRFGLS